MSLEKVPKAAWAGAGVLILVIAVGLILLLSGSSSSGEDLEFTGSGYPGVDVANTRQATGPIDSSNVAELKVAWTLPLTAQSSYGAYASSPIIAKGVIYSQDLESNVQAIDLESGEVLWTKTLRRTRPGPERRRRRRRAGVRRDADRPPSRSTRRPARRSGRRS